MRTSLTSLLGDADGSGLVDAPAAGAVEGALGQLNIAGDIGTALGLTLDSTLQSADETRRASAWWPRPPSPPRWPSGRRTSPGRSASRDAPGPPPHLAGGLPFDVAASATGFNQLLAGDRAGPAQRRRDQHRRGAAVVEGAVRPGRRRLVTEDRPLAIALRLEVAPIVTTAEARATPSARCCSTATGPPSPPPTTTGCSWSWCSTSAPAMVAGAGRRRPTTFDPPAAGDLDATITQNPNKLPEALVDQVFAQLVSQVFGAAGRAAQLPAARLRRAGAGAGRDRPGRVRVRAARRPGPGRLRRRPADRPPPPGPAQRRAGPWCACASGSDGRRRR